MDLDRFQYLILMGLCLVVTLPLELVLGARVWAQPRRLLAAVAVPVVVFVVWDVVAIARGHWTYNPRYVTGWKLGNLPVEELAFFVVIPICGLLTYEAVRRILTERDDVWARLRRMSGRGR
jgi:lycopene cyclase domain-containing protein